jgi:putative NADPH-quinone reductase
MKSLIIVGHPKYNNSIANRTIVQNLSSIKNIEISNIIELYPNYKININAEQKKLIEADLIVFQFPIYWASMPAILKLWIDEVFTNGFAFGSNYKLKNKKLIVSATLSGNENIESKNNVTNKILFPFEGLAHFCKMQYLKPLILYEMNYERNKNKDFFTKKAIKHSVKLLETIKNEINK